MGRIKGGGGDGGEPVRSPLSGIIHPENLRNILCRRRRANSFCASPQIEELEISRHNRSFSTFFSKLRQCVFSGLRLNERQPTVFEFKFDRYLGMLATHLCASGSQEEVPCLKLNWTGVFESSAVKNSNILQAFGMAN